MKAITIQSVRRFTLWQPLTVRDFRLLWLGQGVSLFGDRFHIVALAMLAYELTGSAFALGTVLMAEGGTRALFQLLAGAMTDRFSPRIFMLVSNLVRGIVVGAITLAIATGTVKFWHLYVLAVIFGLVSAFFFPAYMSIIPSLIRKDYLPAGNALLRGTNQLMGLIGPALAGILISSYGLGIAFGLDAITFLFATVTVWLMNVKPRRIETPADGMTIEPENKKPKGLRASIYDGLRYVWSDPVLRTLLLFTAVIEFSFAGPSTVGLASLANSRFSGRAEALGTMLSAFGGGMLVGILSGGSMNILKRRGLLLSNLCILIGVALAAMGLVPNLVTACVMMFMLGTAGGLANVVLISWLQTRSKPQMLGRVMSLGMLAVSILEPASYAISGVLADMSVTVMFAGGGAVMLLAATVSMTNHTMRASD